MDAPSSLPVDPQDCSEPEQLQDRVCDGNGPKPVTRKTTGKWASGGRRLSTITEREPAGATMEPRSQDPLSGSSFSACSSKFDNGSSCLSSDDSYQPDTGDTCASLLLACLHCRFHELMVLLPGACERAVEHCCPSYRYMLESDEGGQQGPDCCSYRLELDCSCCGSCQDAGELLELAMEISEVCYR